MDNRSLWMNSESVESMQSNLQSGEPVIFASYGLVGCIIAFGGAGLLVDFWLKTGPWGLLAGLLLGLCAGFIWLARLLAKAPTRTE